MRKNVTKINLMEQNGVFGLLSLLGGGGRVGGGKGAACSQATFHAKFFIALISFLI